MDERNEFFIIPTQQFNYGNEEIRIINIDGEPWFVALDVCQALEIENSSVALSRLDEGDLCTTEVTSESNLKKFARKTQNMRLVNEPGLYELIFNSRKEEAKQFKRWITKEVLPSLRKTGKYQIHNVDNLTEDEKRVVIREQIKKHNPELSEAAKQAGVGCSGNKKQDNIEFAIFHNKGYQGLYNGLGKRDIAAKKGIKEKENILDYMNSTELAANFFRVTQTKEKLKKEQIKGKDKAYQAHYLVGVAVRKAMEEISGIYPEDIPFVENIRKLGKNKKKETEKVEKKVNQTKPLIEKIEIDISTELWTVALLIASTKPEGIVLTKDLQEEIYNYIHIPEEYEEQNDQKHEPKFKQIIRNIKSNKKNKTSIFSQGYATEVKGGFKITQEGLEFVQEAFKNFLE